MANSKQAIMLSVPNPKNYEIIIYFYFRLIVVITTPGDSPTQLKCLSPDSIHRDPRPRPDFRITRPRRDCDFKK